MEVGRFQTSRQPNEVDEVRWISNYQIWGALCMVLDTLCFKIFIKLFLEPLKNFKRLFYRTDLFLI